MARPVFYPTRRGGRVVECGGLENRLACIGSRGFESLLLRQFEFWAPSDGSFFCYWALPMQKQEEGFEPVGVRSWANARAFAAQHARCESAAALPARSAGDIPPPPSVCLCARSLKVFDGAIVFKPHIVKVSLAGHGVGRADGVCSCGLDGYFAVGC